MKTQLLVASGNPGKLKEIREILSELEIDIISPDDVAIKLFVKETGNTYQENARLKADAYHRATGMPVLADDSGLEVEALDGAPGIHSARYSPKNNASDADRRRHLLSQLNEKPHPWKAHFHCTAILAMPEDKYLITNGRCDGVIIPEERGDHGFGYDPIFYLPEEKATMAELPSDVKNQISHRAKALLTMMPGLIEHLV